MKSSPLEYLADSERRQVISLVSVYFYKTGEGHVPPAARSARRLPNRFDP